MRWTLMEEFYEVRIVGLGFCSFFFFVIQQLHEPFRVTASIRNRKDYFSNSDSRIVEEYFSFYLMNIIASQRCILQSTFICTEF